MRAEIICVGSELLLGDIADTNTQYLAQRLAALGIDLHFSTSVGDNLERLLDCLRRAMGRSDLILTTGGLGPTDDDLTREAIAALLHETPVVNEKLADELRRFFELRRMEMTPNNLKQASLIPSARAIPNRRGTAPGWCISTGTRHIIAMPGPPGELHRMWEEEIEPRLRRDAVIRSRTLKLFDISESRVDVLLKTLTPAANPTVAVYAKQDGIYVRITAKARNDEAAWTSIASIETQVRDILGGFIWGSDEETQESVIAALLRSHGLTLALGETITGGRLSALLTAVPGNEGWFLGSLIPVAHVHPLTAPALAEQVEELFKPDIALGVCGIRLAGEEPEMDEITIAIRDRRTGATRTTSHRMRRDRVRTLGAYYALHELRRPLD